VPCISLGRAQRREPDSVMAKTCIAPSQGLPSMRLSPTNSGQAIGIADVLMQQPAVSHTAVRQNQRDGVDIHVCQQPPSIRIPIEPALAEIKISTRSGNDEGPRLLHLWIDI
jgi:hypothetical protein